MIIKLCAFAIICALCALVIKRLSPAFPVAITVAGSVAILGAVFLGSQEIWSELFEIGDIAHTREYVRIMFKALGVAVIAQISANICRDCGEASIAEGVELAGKVEILILCIAPTKEIVSYVLKILSSV